MPTVQTPPRLWIARRIRVACILVFVIGSLLPPYVPPDALAVQVAQLLGVPRLAGLQRLKDTPPQAGQPDRHARWRNVAAAFHADPSAAAGALVLVIDDVCTTGATLNACGVALKQAGATAVYGLTLARAV